MITFINRSFVKAVNGTFYDHQKFFAFQFRNVANLILLATIND